MHVLLKRLLGTTVLWDADGKGGAGEAGDAPAAPAAAPEPDAGADAPEDPPPVGLDGATPPKIVNNDGVTKEKPQGLPDDYWDRHKGTVKLDSLIKSYNDTKSLVGKKAETIREEVRAEVLAELSPDGVPESIDDYAIPEAVAQAVSVDDPLLKAFHQAAHEAKIPHSTFTDMLNKVVSAVHVPDAAAEKTKLGDNADRRIEVVAKFVDRHVKDAGVRAIADQIATTADGVILLESLILGRAAAERVGSEGGSAGSSAAPTMAEIKVLMADDRYMGSAMDPAYVAMVDGKKDQYFASKGQKRAAKSF